MENPRKIFVKLYLIPMLYKIDILNNKENKTIFIFEVNCKTYYYYVRLVYYIEIENV